MYLSHPTMKWVYWEGTALGSVQCSDATSFKEVRHERVRPFVRSERRELENVSTMLDIHQIDNPCSAKQIITQSPEIFQISHKTSMWKADHPHSIMHHIVQNCTFMLQFFRWKRSDYGLTYDIIVLFFIKTYFPLFTIARCCLACSQRWCARLGFDFVLQRNAKIVISAHTWPAQDVIQCSRMLQQCGIHEKRKIDIGGEWCFCVRAHRNETFNFYFAVLVKALMYFAAHSHDISRLWNHTVWPRRKVMIAINNYEKAIPLIKVFNS